MFDVQHLNVVFICTKHVARRGVAVLEGLCSHVYARCKHAFAWRFGAGLGSELMGIVLCGSREFETKQEPSLESALQCLAG